MLTRLAGDERAAAMIEYGLIIALLAVACITALSALGSELGSVLEWLRSVFQGANSRG